MSKIRKIRNEIEEVGDVDMTPIMSLFVILIPFLLLAAVFVKINIINSPFPQYSSGNNDNKDNFSLSVYVKQDSLLIETMGKNNKKTTQKISMKEGKHQLDDLHKKLVNIKKSYPKEYRLNLYPDPAIEYETIVEVMDISRDMHSDDPTIFIKDQDGKNIKQEYLFPDVVWMGVLS